MTSYINGFTESARAVFEAFGFESEIEKLDKANRLYLIVKDYTYPKIDLHPDRVSNHDMSYVFEELVRRLNEQANEEAGDHFTPREVIRLMAHLIYTEDEDVYTPGIVRTIYDHTAASCCSWCAAIARTTWPAKCCLLSMTPGSTTPRPRLATKSPCPGISKTCNFYAYCVIKNTSKQISLCA